ncbi:flavin-containing monooxygenase [Nakamurella flava]|uniref:flavin-containing monooxygenase n=1 Tax=Nakamurella flava TaxID=2576308 RepID=UPI00197C9588|nr:NAD(P)-binding domain-containing protein [Nakamurella flava]
MRSAVADLVVIGGGQSGLAAALAATAHGIRPIVLERSTALGGAWRHYWDSLTLFSPARYAGLADRPMTGDPDRYPHRDEIVAYLDGVAAGLTADVRTDWPVDWVRRAGSGRGFVVGGAAGEIRAHRIVSATGRYGRPRHPERTGLDGFTGRVVHTADYRGPADLRGARVVIIGAANSAVQIGAELSRDARVTLASRRPIRWARQRPLGRDMHWWLDRTGLDRAPIGPLLAGRTTPVLDDGRWRAAFRPDRLDRRPLPLRVGTGARGDRVLWQDGSTERVDVIVLATGYHPDVGYLADTGALTADGQPQQRHGVSTTVPGLGYVGLELQRTVASATLRGVSRDADFVIRRLLRQN